MKHLAIFQQKEEIEAILKGQKRMEARFSREKIPPYGRIQKGDEIYLKESGGPLVGKVEVDNVLFYEGLTPEMLGKLRKEYSQDLGVDERFWSRYSKHRYLSLIFLKNPERFVGKVRFPKKDRRGWVILKEEK